MDKLCYVCKKKIRGDHAVYLPADVKSPEGYWRHEDCYPGSDIWMNSEVGKTSEYREYWLNLREEKSSEEIESRNLKKKEAQQKAVKEKISSMFVKKM